MAGSYWAVCRMLATASARRFQFDSSFQLFAALCGQFVKLGLAAFFGFAPLGLEPAALFQAMKAG